MISKETVLRIAALARLSLTPEEEKAFVDQFSAILKSFEQMDTVNTDGVVPLVTPTDIEPQMRADEAQVWDEGLSVVESAPDRSGHLFKVPPVVG